MRLTLAHGGACALRCAPLAADDGLPWRAVLAGEALDAGDYLLRHKTTARARYDGALAALPAGVFDAIFLNTRGEVCEGARSNVFVARGDVLLTAFMALFAGSWLWLPGDPNWVTGGIAAVVGTVAVIGIWVLGKMWAHPRRYVVLSRERVVVAGRVVPWAAVTEVGSWSVSNGGAAIFGLRQNLPAIGLVLSDDGAREVFGKMGPVLIWLTMMLTLGQWRKYRVVIRQAYVRDADVLLVLLRESLTRFNRARPE